MLWVCLLFALFVKGCYEVESQIPLSKASDAYQRGNKGSSVIVELFIDLSCSSCLLSWPTLTQVYEAYHEDVNFLYRVFPLPYHQQGFIVAKAAQVVNAFGSSTTSVFTYMNHVFSEQDLIYNSATADMTYNEVIKLVSTFATNDTGVNEVNYYIGMNSSTTIGSLIEMNTRYMWKFCALRGAYGTPLYAINGLYVSGLDTFEDWETTLDNLLA